MKKGGEFLNEGKSRTIKTNSIRNKNSVKCRQPSDEGMPHKETLMAIIPDFKNFKHVYRNDPYNYENLDDPNNTTLQIRDFLNKHPNYFNFFVGKCDDPKSFIFKYGGVDLGTYLRMDKKASLIQLLPHILNIANAIKFLQEYNLTHTDIKPENIFIVKPPNGVTQMVLIDLGFVRTLDSVYRKPDIENDVYRHFLKQNGYNVPPELIVYYAFLENKAWYNEENSEFIIPGSYIVNDELNGLEPDFQYDIEKNNRLMNFMYLIFRDGYSTNDMYGNKIINIRPRNKYWKKNIDNYDVQAATFVTTLVESKIKYDKNLLNTPPITQLENTKVTDEVYELLNSNLKVSPNDEDHFTKMFAKKLDVFSLGYVLNVILLAYTSKEPYYKELKTIVQNTYNVNPYTRWDIYTTIQALNRIIDQQASARGGPTAARPGTVAQGARSTRKPPVPKTKRK